VVELDREVPALVVKVGRYPVHSGGVGAVRALGRLGVRAHVITEDHLTPLALSRYSADRFIWPTTGTESTDVLVAGLADIGQRIGRPAVAIATDDEAATLLAEHANELSEHFLVPRVRPDLPRQLASKHQLHLLCRQHSVPTPRTILLRSRAELAHYADQITYPVVAKNPEPWLRRRAPVVHGTTTVHTAEELIQLASADHAQFSVLVQEHIPPRHAQDWIVHLYRATNTDRTLLFTGLKVRSWPVDAGSTACAYAAPNPELANLTEQFCRQVGFRGIADLDWRLDLRDGQYKLVDFNPRVGNQFPLFRTSEGIDVVTAQHLDLTGRWIPSGKQVNGRRIVVEEFDLPARLARPRASLHAPRDGGPAHSIVFAWAARDDLLPLLAVCLRLVLPLLSTVGRRLSSRYPRSRTRTAHRRSAEQASPGWHGPATRDPRASMAARSTRTEKRLVTTSHQRRP
jgi:D-aspartate ligase